jgi:hypothetical protein
MKRFFILASFLAMGSGVFAGPGSGAPAGPGSGVLAGPGSGRPVSIVQARVLRDFMLRFDEVSLARWMTDGKGSTMYFMKDGFLNRAGYDLKGSWKYSLIFYGESKLPRDVRAVVKREYFDFGITIAEEVQTTAGKAYLIHLEDKSTHKIVRVNMDGEMDTLEEYTKQ